MQKRILCSLFMIELDNMKSKLTLIHFLNKCLWSYCGYLNLSSTYNNFVSFADVTHAAWVGSSEVWLKRIRLQQNMTLLFLSNTRWTLLIVFSCDWTSEQHEHLNETMSILTSHSYPSVLSCLILLLIFLFSHLPLFPPLAHSNCRLCLFPINYPVEHPHRSSHTHHMMAKSLTNIPLTSSQMTRH